VSIPKFLEKKSGLSKGRGTIYLAFLENTASSQEREKTMHALGEKEKRGNKVCFRVTRGERDGMVAGRELSFSRLIKERGGFTFRYYGLKGGEGYPREKRPKGKRTRKKKNIVSNARSSS